MPAGVVVSPVKVRAELAATPPERTILAGLKASVRPEIPLVPSSSRLNVPEKLSGVPVKLKVAWPTAFNVNAVLSMKSQ